MKRILDIKRYFWADSDSLVWKYSEKASLRSRKKKLDLFMSIMAPKQEETILDVGVSPISGRGTNFLERWYPFPEKITALSSVNEKLFVDFKKNFPLINLVFGDGRKLSFANNEFDIVFSNAVVEHTGEIVNQKRFIHEIVRVGKRAFITTPNYWFPVDSHTLIPFAHWLPVKIRYKIYNILGRGYFADINKLNLLTLKKFLNCFPSNVEVKIYKQRMFGITASLIAVVEKRIIEAN